MWAARRGLSSSEYCRYMRVMCVFVDRSLYLTVCTHGSALAELSEAIALVHCLAKCHKLLRSRLGIASNGAKRIRELITYLPT